MAPSHASFLRPAGAEANGVGRLKGSHQRSLGMESPDSLPLAFRGGLSLHLQGDKAESPWPGADRARECQRPRLIRDRGPVPLRAVAAQEIAVAVEIHPPARDLFRAVPPIQ